MALTDAQLEAVRTAMDGGTPLHEIVNSMDLEERPMQVRKQLNEKYGADDINDIIQNKIRPNITPARRLRMMISRVIKNNPDTAEAIKTELSDYIARL